ncbi:DC-STAMP domain-containing protein 2-like isoform X2 [Clavelina lepadiformis]
MWKPSTAAMWTGFFGFFISLGMAFLKPVRCIVALLLPTFSTGKGRSIIMAFSLMLVITGPSANIAYNYRQMSTSLTCGDELGFNVTQGLRPLVHDGKNAILSTMEDTIDAIIEAVEEAEERYRKFSEKLKSVTDVIKSLNNFMLNMGSICNAKLGAFLCIIPNFVAKQAKRLITEPVKDAIADIKAEFAFNISFVHELKYDVNASKSAHEISKDIMREVEEKIGGVTNVFEWVRFAMGFSTLFVILKAMKYREKYLTANEFDNFYITEDFVKLDNRRKKQGKVTVLPLRARENSKYIRPSNIWMSRAEVKKFAKGAIFLSINFFYTLAVIAIDYGFYTMLHSMTTSLSLRKQARSLAESIVKKAAKETAEAVGLGDRGSELASQLISLTVSGVGFVTVIYRSIASALERIASSEGYNFAIDKCLPIPRGPDYNLYIVILSLYLFLYILCIIEAYVLRTRRRIMARFYPKRERIRILYLRTRILGDRGVSTGGSPASSALQRACLSVQQTKEQDRTSLVTRLANKRGVVGWVARHLTGKTKHRCDICKLAGGAADSKLFTRCLRFGCRAQYCVECFEDLHRICVSCLLKQGNERRKPRRSGAGSREQDEEIYNELAQDLFDSSGISDSSATSTEDEEDDVDDVKTTKQVRFKDGYQRKYIPLDVGNESSSDDETNTGAT